jgi:hypothetical protein
MQVVLEEDGMTIPMSERATSPPSVYGSLEFRTK